MEMLGPPGPVLAAGLEGGTVGRDGICCGVLAELLRGAEPLGTVVIRPAARSCRGWSPRPAAGQSCRPCPRPPSERRADRIRPAYPAPRWWPRGPCPGQYRLLATSLHWSEPRPC